MRPIDADALIKWIDLGHLRSPSELCYSEFDVVNILKSAPTLDVQPVRRGEWVFVLESVRPFETEIEERCSLCGRYVQRYGTQSQDNFCPNCGADMRGETHGTD